MELLELIQPLTKEKIYANIATGQCFWNPPFGCNIKSIANQWWELFDVNTSKFYYYDSASETTVWKRPYNVEVIALAKLQHLDDDTVRRPEMKSATTQTCFSEVHTTDFSQSVEKENDLKVRKPDQHSESKKLTMISTNESNPVSSCSLIVCADDCQKLNHCSDLKQVCGQLLYENSVENFREPVVASYLPLNSPGGSHSAAVVSSDANTADSTVLADHQYEYNKHEVKIVDSQRAQLTDNPEEIERERVQTAKTVDSIKTELTNPQCEFEYEGILIAQMLDSQRTEVAYNRHEGMRTVETETVDSVTTEPTENQREFKHEGVQTAFDSDVKPDITYSVQLNPTPRTRRAFPRTNPACVPNSGDRKYTRRSSAEGGLVTSFTSSSLKESSNFHGARRATIQRTLSSEHDDAKQAAPPLHLDERAIDCSLMNSNSGKALDQTGACVLDVNAVCGPCSQEKVEESDSLDKHPTTTVPEELFKQDSTTVDAFLAGERTRPEEPLKQDHTNNANIEVRDPLMEPTNITVEDDETMNALSVHRNMSASEVTRTYASVSSTTSFQAEQSLYRQKKGRFDQRRFHRRQSSESDLSYLQDPDFARRSIQSYASGSALSVSIAEMVHVDESITSSLSRHRVGLIRRKPVSVVNMLSWTKDPIKKPMFRTSDRFIKKEAVEAFKLIQTYMGDRTCKIAPSRVALDVISRGWSNSQLRDEIYMQLTRQLTDNPHEASVIRGWELVTLCLAMFPPSAKFQSYLEGFITRHVDQSSLQSEASVKRFAQQCQQRFNRATKHGARRGQKPPSLDEIEIALKSIYHPSMFGSTLSDIMQLQASQFPERQLPWIQHVLSEEILRLNGLQTEGIFRISGDIDEVNSLKTRCERWIAPTGCNEAHTPASLLKMWYRQLHEPLIPDDMYRDCIDFCSDTQSCIQLVEQLPALNRIVFCYLVRFLQMFITPENVAVTKMDLNNIAMIWAPNCLHCPSESPLVIIENSSREMLFLRNVIENLDTGFMQDVY